MQDTALFKQLLGLSSPWEVKSVTPELEAKSIRINIEWPIGKVAHCPDCGEACSIYDHREERSWRHLDTMQFKTLLICAVPRVDCPVHGVKSLPTPWAESHSRFTLLFERFAIEVLLSASNKSKAAELLGLSWDEVHHIQEHAVNRGLSRRDLSATAHIGMDEKSFLRGQSYVSVLYEIGQSRVLEVVQDRTEEAARTLLKTLPEEGNARVEAVAVDMWKPFLNAIEAVLPQADIVHDKFHIVSYLTDAVDAVRRQENKALQAEEIKDLTGTRYVWLKSPKNWSDKDRATFDALKTQGLKVGRAWSMKEAFLGLWNYTYEGSARNFFSRWYYWATHSRLKPMIEVAKMFKRHLDNILTYLHYHLTNATAEGMNSKIQSIKSAARGFRNFANYRIAILFYCGGLNVYP